MKREALIKILTSSLIIGKTNAINSGIVSKLNASLPKTFAIED